MINSTTRNCLDTAWQLVCKVMPIFLLLLLWHKDMQQYALFGIMATNFFFFLQPKPLFRANICDVRFKMAASDKSECRSWVQLPLSREFCTQVSRDRSIISVCSCKNTIDVVKNSSVGLVVCHEENKYCCGYCRIRALLVYWFHLKIQGSLS